MNQIIISLLIGVIIIKSTAIHIENGVAFEKVTPLHFVHSDLIVTRDLTILHFDQVLDKTRGRLERFKFDICGSLREAQQQLLLPRSIFTQSVVFSDAQRACTKEGGYLPSLATPEDREEVKQLLNTITTELPRYLWAGLSKSQTKKSYYWQKDNSFARDSTAINEFVHITGSCQHEYKYMHSIDEMLQYDYNWLWYLDHNATIFGRSPSCTTNGQTNPKYPAFCILPKRQQSVDITKKLEYYCEVIGGKHVEDLTVLKREITPLFNNLNKIIKQQKKDIGLVHSIANQHRPTRSINHYNCNDNMTFHDCQQQREKRFITTVTTLGIARTVTSEIMGQVQLSNLNSRLDDHKIRLDILNGTVLDYKDELDRISHQTEAISKRLSLLEQQVDSLIRLQLISESFAKIIEHLYLHFNIVKNVITGLMEKRTTTHVLPYEDLGTLDTLLHDHKALSVTTKDYTRMTSELIKANFTHLTVQITIPLWETTAYNVYKLYTIPDLHHKLIPQSDEKIVVLSPDSRQYASLTDAQLTFCLTDGCKKPPLIKHTQLSTCGVAQIIGKDTNLCKWDYYPPPVFFERTERGFIYALPHKYNAQIKCPTKYEDYPRVIIEKSGFMEIPPGCKITLLSLKDTHSVDISGPRGELEAAELTTRNVSQLQSSDIVAPIAARTTEFYSLKQHFSDKLDNYAIIITAYKHQNTISLIIGITIALFVSIITTFCVYKRTIFLENQLIAEERRKSFIKNCLKCFKCCQKTEYTPANINYDIDINIENDPHAMELTESEDVDFSHSTSI